MKTYKHRFVLSAFWISKIDIGWLTSCPSFHLCTRRNTYIYAVKERSRWVKKDCSQYHFASLTPHGHQCDSDPITRTLTEKGVVKDTLLDASPPLRCCSIATLKTCNTSSKQVKTHMEHIVAIKNKLNITNVHETQGNTDTPQQEQKGGWKKDVEKYMAFHTFKN